MIASMIHWASLRGIAVKNGRREDEALKMMEAASSERYDEVQKEHALYDGCIYRDASSSYYLYVLFDCDLW